MNGHEKTDGLVVPAKLPNKTVYRLRRRWREAARPRGARTAQHVPDAVPDRAVKRLDRVREVAQKDKDVRFTALLHHVDLSRLWRPMWPSTRRPPRGGQGDVETYDRT